MHLGGMKVLVIGATGGSGRAACAALAERGHEVTAFTRRGGAAALPPDVRTVVGDATSARDVDEAVRGQDAVVVALGIRENAVRVRLFGPARTPLDIRSAGTRNVIRAMQRHGVQRLVVQSSYGVGPTRDRLRFVDSLLFALLLKPQIADTEEQERIVEASGLEWVLAQPVHLTDDADAAPPFASTEGDTAKMSVSRASVGAFLADAVTSASLVGKRVALSAVTA
jgi:uncharacterized protein YbjT (DUF2867 family)